GRLRAGLRLWCGWRLGLGLDGEGRTDAAGEEEGYGGSAKQCAALPQHLCPLRRRIRRSTCSLVDRRCPAQSRPDDWSDRWPNFDAMPPMTAPDGERPWPLRASCRGAFRPIARTQATATVSLHVGVAE